MKQYDTQSMDQDANSEDAIRLYLRKQIPEIGCRSKNFLICAEVLWLFCQFLIRESVKRKVPCRSRALCRSSDLWLVPEARMIRSMLFKMLRTQKEPC